MSTTRATCLDELDRDLIRLLVRDAIRAHPTSVPQPSLAQTALNLDLLRRRLEETGRVHP